MRGLQGLLLCIVDASFHPQYLLVQAEGIRDAFLPVHDLLTCIGQVILHLLELNLRVKQLGLDEVSLELWMALGPLELTR